jgi:hypothetical protein
MPPQPPIHIADSTARSATSSSLPQNPGFLSKTMPTRRSLYPADVRLASKAETRCLSLGAKRRAHRLPLRAGSVQLKRTAFTPEHNKIDSTNRF